MIILTQTSAITGARGRRAAFAPGGVLSLLSRVLNLHRLLRRWIGDV